jgi:hypothetical protein
MIKKSHYQLLFLILGSISLNFLFSPPYEIFFDDKEIFKYGGLVIYKGGVPYRDFFDHKPPLIYFLNSLNWYISPWVPWILDTLLVLFATLLFYWLCRKSKLTWPWFLPVLFNLLIRYSLVSFGNGMTREYTACFLLISFCVMQGNARYKYFILGILSGLTAWMQQDALLTLAPFLLYSVFGRETPSSRFHWDKILNIGAGFFVVSIPLILYFNAHQSLGYLWKDAFLFNLQVPGDKKGLLDKIKSIKHAIHESEFEMAFYTALILGITALFLKNKKLGLLYMALLTLGLSFSAEFLTGRMNPGNSFIYYLLPLAASIPILVYVVRAETQVPLFQDKTALLIFNLILSTTLFLGTLGIRPAFVSGLIKTTGLPGCRKSNISKHNLYMITSCLYSMILILFICTTLIKYYRPRRGSIIISGDGVLTGTVTIQYSFPFFGICSFINPFYPRCSAARNNTSNKTVFNNWQLFLQSHYG